MAATGIYGGCLLYAVNRAFETSVVSRICVQPSWFDIRYKLVRSEKQKYPKCKREGAVGVDSERDEFNERRREDFQRDWREI